MPDEPRPTVGRIVLYEGWPCIVCELYSDGMDAGRGLVDLCVFKPPVPEYVYRVPREKVGVRGWTWPPRAPDPLAAMRAEAEPESTEEASLGR